MLREHQNTRDPAILRSIYKAACDQYNMSCICQKHGLYWVPPGDRRIRRERTVTNPEAGFQPGRGFPFFSRLVDGYPEIARNIVAYTMTRHTAISVVLRYDFHDIYPPTQKFLDPKSGLPYRYHWGGRACAINSAPLPKYVLAPMFVCRDWHEMFGTAFFYLNSFSFESLGEFQIFCDRTDPQYLERILTLMITWIGSRMVSSNPRKNGPRYCPSRHGMHILNSFTNLRTFEIRIDESSSNRVRRKHENKPKRRPLQKSTKNHQNFTGNRSLRTMRGLDSITQLRGLKRLEIFDYNRRYPRATIRDQTFLEDTRRQVYSPKRITDKRKANLKTLPPLWKRDGPDDWVMSEKVREIVDGIFDMRPDEAEGEAEDEIAGNAGDDPDDDDGDEGGDDQNRNQDPGDRDDTRNDEFDLEDDFLQGSDNDTDTDTDTDDDDDDAPDQDANASRAAPAVSRTRNFAHGRGEVEDDEDEDIEMDGLKPKNVIKLEDDSDDDGFEFIHSEKRSSVKIEDDDELTFIGSVKRPTQTIDLSHLPDMEDQDTAFPSIEEGQEMKGVKAEDSTSVGGETVTMEDIPAFQERHPVRRETRSPFGPLPPRRGHTDQSSLFVRQSPSSQRSFSSSFFGYLGRPSSEKKRTIKEDDEVEDIVARPSLRRRLSAMTVDEDEMEE